MQPSSKITEPVGHRIKALRGLMRGKILRVLSYWHVVWQTDSGAELTALPKALFKRRKNEKSFAMNFAIGSKLGIDATKKIAGEVSNARGRGHQDGGSERERKLTRCSETPLIWVASRANMGRHIMKTTIEIADDLFERAQRVARKEKTTFRSLTEQGLRLVLKEKQTKPKKTSTAGHSPRRIDRRIQRCFVGENS